MNNDALKKIGMSLNMTQGVLAVIIIRGLMFLQTPRYSIRVILHLHWNKNRGIGMV